MTALEEIHFNETLEAPIDHFATLDIGEHTKKVNTVYTAIRPALKVIIGILTLKGILKKGKLSLGLEVLMAALDAYFNAVTPTN